MHPPESTEASMARINGVLLRSAGLSLSQQLYFWRCIVELLPRLSGEGCSTGASRPGASAPACVKSASRLFCGGYEQDLGNSSDHGKCALQRTA